MADLQAEEIASPLSGEEAPEFNMPNAKSFAEYLNQTNSVDYATILGVLGGFAMIISAMILGGRVSAFVDAPSLLIVLGGTFFLTTSSFSFRDVLKAQSIVLSAVIYRAESPVHAAKQCLYLSDVVRRNGLLSLQTHYEDIIKRNRFLYCGLTMLDEGYKIDQLKRMLQQQTQAEHFHKKKAASILRRAGEVSPAMGLIGTLIGLVQMLGSLEDPGAIGPSMAVALLTTFYGAVLANMFFNPVAAKLERLADSRTVVNHLYSVALEAISRRENPRRLQTILNTLLPAEERVDYFD